MLRHVLCVLALALCCCTSLCVATGSTPEKTHELKLTNGAATITLTERFETGNCTPPTTPNTRKTSEVTISTTVALKKGTLEEAKEITNELSNAVKVLDGYNLTLKTSLEVKCTKNGEVSSGTAEKRCPLGETEAADSDTITYVVSVKPTTSVQTTVNIPETQNHEVKVRAGYDVKIVENVVATCAPPTPAEKPPTHSRSVPPGGHQDASSAKTKVGDISHTLEHSSVKDQTPKQQSDKLALEEETPSGKSSTPLSKSTTVSANPDDKATDGGKGSAASNDAPTPTSSEAESTETDNSVTVNGADHTASTATSQSETTNEGASNTDAGTPTSAGEGVKPPGGNTDASSSSTAWVRVPLILLLFACVAVW
ncbi:hypothetical protein DQ04_16351000 [Trypanosoma grayi]|uniref:hypothetical protein n=1 Tax=Trypanosoma grayi TaxID=71804 RepID=UPI0004F49BB8|nr:hypothetical protein DQ04_16351000 [Trypanosoma grayi]KEG06039.1 hypothetical protein DQ04_16351000 [Trypanosoma grayi]